MSDITKRIADQIIDLNYLENAINNQQKPSEFITEVLLKLSETSNSNSKKSILLREYLSQIGKRIQQYWGTTRPKSFIRTFSEIKQLLNSKNKADESAKGLCVSIIAPTDLQRVRLTIEPYFNEEDCNAVKSFLFAKTLFDPFKNTSIDSTVFSIYQPLGVDFCIGKLTPDLELYDYYIIAQIVDLTHQRLVDEQCLPVSIPVLADFNNIVN